MKGKLKIDVLNKYKADRVEEITHTEVISKGLGTKRTWTEKKAIPAYFGKKDEEVVVISNHIDMYIVENKKFERFFVKHSELEIID